MCSQRVLIMFHKVPQDVPNSTSILCHMVCPNSTLMYINGEGGSAFVSILQSGSKRVASIEKHPIYSKQIGDGPILHTKEKQSVSDP